MRKDGFLSSIAYNTFLTTENIAEARNHIGTVDVHTNLEEDKTLQTTKHFAINNSYEEIGNERDMKRKLSFEPSRIMEEAFQTEPQSN